MNWKKAFAFLGIALLVGSAFMPWITVPDRNIVVTGMDGGNTNYGKPAYFNFLMILFFLVLTFINRVGAARINVFFAAMNLAWAIRNLIVIGHCVAGECPVREAGIYLHLISSVIIMIASTMPGNIPKSMSSSSGIE